jgi:hypothetical protein
MALPLVFPSWDE